MLGVGLYGLTYLYPVYLARVRGYSALQIGETMFITGLCMFMMAPVSAQLMKRGADPRLLLALGFTGFAVGTYQVSMMTKDWDFNELLIPQILRGVSLMLIMIPVTNTALGTTAPHKLKNASGLFNLMRNLGGAFGLAIINTLINKRLDLHLARLHEQVAWGRGTAEETLAKLHRADGALRLGRTARRHQEACRARAASGHRHVHRRCVHGAYRAVLVDCTARAVDAEARARRWRGGGH